MTSVLKKTLLSAAFLSTAFMAGCRSDKPAPQPEQKKVHYYTEAEMTKTVTAAYAAKGVDVLKGECYLDTPNSFGSNACDFTVQAKVDDGVLYTAHVPAGDSLGTYTACATRDSKPGDALDAAAEKAFNASARAKFSRLGFTTLESFEDPDVSYSIFTDGVCGQTTSATFLLRQGGRLYSADYSQDYSYSDHAGSNGRVENLSTISRREAAAAEDEAAADAPESDSATEGDAPRRSAGRESKPAESKLCIGSCIGPHIDLQTGKVKMLGTGPGYKF